MFCKELILQAQEWSIPTCRKSGKGGRRPTQINKELLTKLKHKKKACKRGMQDQVIQEKQIDTECTTMGLGKPSSPEVKLSEGCEGQ